MIWPEFRLHSIVFASRHVISTMLTIADLWPKQTVPEICTKLGLIILTTHCASLITNRYGDREKRTTNAMPYPPWITGEVQQSIKEEYMRAQFGATQVAMLPDATLNFFPLFGIQSAPLLMTLVRKGKIASITYHRIYSLSLTLVYIAYMVRLFDQSRIDAILIVVICGTFPIRYLRMAGVSTLKTWMGYALFQLAASYLVLPNFGACAVPGFFLTDAVSRLTHCFPNTKPKMCQLCWILLNVLWLLVLWTVNGMVYPVLQANVLEPYIIGAIPFMVGVMGPMRVGVKFRYRFLNSKTNKMLG